MISKNKSINIIFTYNRKAYNNSSITSKFKKTNTQDEHKDNNKHKNAKAYSTLTTYMAGPEATHRQDCSGMWQQHVVGFLLSSIESSSNGFFEQVLSLSTSLICKKCNFPSAVPTHIMTSYDKMQSTTSERDMLQRSELKTGKEKKMINALATLICKEATDCGIVSCNKIFLVVDGV